MNSSTITIKKSWYGELVEENYIISFQILRSSGDLMISVDAPFFDDPPPPLSACKYSELHLYEVVEIFISGCPKSDGQFHPYLEIQIGPHGHYMLVSFLNEGEWATQDATMELEQFPEVSIYPISSSSRSSSSPLHMRWKASVTIPSFLLPEPLEYHYIPSETSGLGKNLGDVNDLSLTWQVNAYAMHGTGTGATGLAGSADCGSSLRKYLAYSPPTGVLPESKPNFHLLSSFAPLRLVETSELRQRVDRSVSLAEDQIQIQIQKRALQQHTDDRKEVRGCGASFSPQELLFGRVHIEKIPAGESNAFSEESNEKEIYEGNDPAGADAEAAKDLGMGSCRVGGVTSSIAGNNIETGEQSIKDQRSRAGYGTQTAQIGAQIDAPSINDLSLTPLQRAENATAIVNPVQHIALKIRDQYLHTAAGAESGDGGVCGVASQSNPSAEGVNCDLGPALLSDDVLLGVVDLQKHVHKDEFVVLHGLVTKRKGLSWKSRRLLLTSAPRLLYFTERAEFKGVIPWSTTRKIRAKKISETKFDLTVFDNSRTYHFTVKGGRADVWVDAITELTQAQRAYLRASLQGGK